MLRTGKGSFKVICVALFLLTGITLPGMGISAHALSSPCETKLLTLAADPISPFLPKYTIASMPARDRRAANEGCFSTWLPLQLEATTLRLSTTRFELPETLGSGLFSHLQTIWDQETFINTRKSLALFGFGFGNVATLEAEREAIVALLERVANHLIPSSQTGNGPAKDMSFTLNLNQIHLTPQTLLNSTGVFSLDDHFNVFLEDLTITVSNGTFMGETQLNPETLAIERGAFQIKLDVGNATVSSTTTFEKYQGVTKQVLNMTARLGSLQLQSQVTLTLDSSEFRLAASIADLVITTISTQGASGSSQTFELQFNF